MLLKCQIQTIQNRGGKTTNYAASNLGVLPLYIAILKDPMHIFTILAHCAPPHPTPPRSNNN